MKNSEDLVLFLLGVVTIGITSLLLFSLGSGVRPVIEQHAKVPAKQADAVPRPQMPEPPRTEGLDLEVAETFKRAAAYIGRGKFEEKEHIALLERLEFYNGLSSINPEHRKAAQDLTKDMNLLLALKESVERQVKLSGQINAAVTDAQIHLAEGKTDEAAARKIMNRIKSLYAISGLTEDQNRQLRTALSALRNANKTTDRRTVSVPASVPEVEPRTEPKPAPKTRVVLTLPKNADPSESQIVKQEYYKVYTSFSRYWSKKKNNRQRHDKITAELLEISEKSDFLTEDQQGRLSEAIEDMERIGNKFRPGK